MSWQKDILPQNALVWLDFRSQFDRNGVRVIENNGKLATSPSVVTCGDGTTTSSFPSQLVGSRGVNFDGAVNNKRVNCGAYLMLGNNQSFTIVSVYKASAGNVSLLSSVDSGTLVGGIQLLIGGGYDVVFSLYGNGTTNSIRLRNSANDCKLGIIQSIITTYNGSSSTSGAIIYMNGMVSSARNVYSDSLTQTIVTSNPIMIGVNKSSASWNVPFSGDIYHTSIFPKCLTSQQVSMLHDNLMHQFNLP
jgi:hypothetical protein